MKYQCEKCAFHWEGTSYTFEKVREVHGSVTFVETY
jgi:hypothetical protein